MAELCDVAYVLLVERVERMCLAALAAGADVDMGEALAGLDSELDAAHAERSDLSPEQQLLRHSLGL